MAGNLIQDGTTITLPTGTARTNGSLYGISSGVGAIVGVANDTYTAAQIPTLIVQGVFDLTKTAAAASSFSQGDPVYATTGAGALVALNSTATSDVFVGTAWETVTTTATSVKVNINFGGGRGV